MRKIIYLFTLLAVNLSFSQDYSNLVKNYLQQNRSQYQLQPQDVADISVASQSFSKSLRGHNVYVEQRYQGIKVFNSTSPFLIKDGVVANAKVSFVNNIASKVNTTSPSITASMAISKAAAALGLDAPSNLVLFQSGADNSYIFTNGNISLENIPVQLVFQKMEDTNAVKLAWDLSIYLLDASHYYSVRIDAMTGDLLETMDWVSQCAMPEFSGVHRHDNNAAESVLLRNNSEAQKEPMLVGQYRVFEFP